MLPAVDGAARILAPLARNLMGFNGNIEKSGKYGPAALCWALAN